MRSLDKDKIIMQSPEHTVEVANSKELTNLELELTIAAKHVLLKQLAEVKDAQIALFLAVRLNNICYDIAKLSKCLETGFEVTGCIP